MKSLQMEKLGKRPHSLSEESMDTFTSVKRFEFESVESPLMASNPVCQLESKFMLDDSVMGDDKLLSDVSANGNLKFNHSLETPIKKLSESTSAMALLSPIKKDQNMSYASPVSVLFGGQEMSPDFTAPASDYAKSTPSKANNKKIMHSIMNLTPIKKPSQISTLHFKPSKRNNYKSIHHYANTDTETNLHNTPGKLRGENSNSHEEGKEKREEEREGKEEKGGEGEGEGEGEEKGGELDMNHGDESTARLKFFRLAHELSEMSVMDSEQEMHNFFDDDSPSTPSTPSTPRTPPSVLPSFSLECPESPVPSSRSREMCRQSSLNDTKVLLTTALKRSHSIFMFNSHFEYLREIGRGSFSTVYEARDRKKGTLCAVKMSKREFDGKEDRERYMHEIESVANLPEHTNIVKYYRGWQQNLHFFLQMELCEGGSLREHMDKLTHPLSEQKVWEYIRQIASALYHLHARGVLHLDIKPANIFLDLSGLLKIGDFGRAVLSQQWQWEDGDGGYLAPEMLRFGKATSAADVYSFGAMCYEWMTLSLLPREWSEREMAIEAFGSDRASSYGETLVRLVKMMLSENLSERPSAEAILQCCNVTTAFPL